MLIFTLFNNDFFKFLSPEYFKCADYNKHHTWYVIAQCTSDFTQYRYLLIYQVPLFTYLPSTDIYQVLILTQYRYSLSTYIYWVPIFTRTTVSICSTIIPKLWLNCVWCCGSCREVSQTTFNSKVHYKCPENTQIYP